MVIIGKVATASEIKPPHRAMRVQRLEFDVPAGRAWAHISDYFGNKDTIKVELPCCMERLQVRDVLEVRT